MTLARRLRILSPHYEIPPMQPLIQVAFASADLKQVDQHFGAALGFVIHRVGPHHDERLEAIRFEPIEMDGNERKLEVKIAALQGCAAVYCAAIGASAVHRLRREGIQSLKVEPGTTIALLVSGLQQQLREQRTPWIRQALAPRPFERERRFEHMEAEGWCE